jgi:hypothetical protein
MKRQTPVPEPWQPLQRPEDQEEPCPLALRVQSLPARFFAEHTHPWHQFVYASTGVLTVTAAGQCFVIAPQQAVWVPAGLPHRTGSLLGQSSAACTWRPRPCPGRRAVRTAGGHALPARPHPGGGQPAPQERSGPDAQHLFALILSRLARLQPLPAALPWPDSPGLAPLCEALYADPADPRDLDAWAAQLHQSGRT